MESFLVKVIMPEETLLKYLTKEYVDKLPQPVKQELGEQLQKLQSYREQYKQIIVKHFQEEEKNGKLFLSKLNGYLEREYVTHNLTLLVDLAAHCIVIGDTEILDIFVINPLKIKKSHIAEDIRRYCNALTQLEISCEREQQKTYLRILIKKLKQFE